MCREIFCIGFVWVCVEVVGVDGFGDGELGCECGVCDGVGVVFLLGCD